ncbi:MAG: tetratricopeptide repeat protein [Chthoniobacterales bacterium]
MKRATNALGVLVLWCATFGSAHAQLSDEIRRALPVEDPPIQRALPVESSTPRRVEPAPPVATPVPRPSVASTPRESAPEPAPVEERVAPPPSEVESPEERQLNYANGLFLRKIYDLAIPEYEKFLGQFQGAAGRASAFFYLGECYRTLNKTAPARTSFQSVLNEYPESDFAGPAAYGVAEILFNQKDYAGAVSLFHRSAAKTKESALALSARYFEARCLENLEKKEDAANLYLQVVEAKNPNPFREDSRMAAGAILNARGRKTDALRQYEALANETSKPELKAETTVRAGLIALELQQAEKGKDKAMQEKAVALLHKGRSLAEAGKWRGIAQVGLLRLFYSTGQYAQVLAEYKKSQENIPEDVRAEMMLVAANSERQLGNEKAAETIYAQIVAKYPSREEAKDARYQRLINIYNSTPSALVGAVDEFLATNPTAERADQAKLLKAETFYKEGKFAEAAPLYEELRASQLSPKLRAEAAYKLGWCYVQTKSMPRVVDAFTYFLKAFPENPQAPVALTQRSLAHQETKSYAEAIADLDALLKNYPQAKEREGALQQKALLLGQQDNGKAMSETFQQLLKEYPKSAVAAQAQYYIGKAAFEAKDYEAAIPALEAARKLNKEQFYTPSTVRIISSYFYLKNRAALTAEIDKFLAADPNAKVPGEILQSIGIEFYNEKNYAAAAKYLTLLGTGQPTGVSADFWFYLADAHTKLGQFAAAEASYEKYLQNATDPAARVKTLLALGATKIAAHKADEAQKIAEEIMSLQPEGKVNAEARLLAGDVQVERGNFEEAAKSFMSVALLYDDPAITPRALQKAATAYEKAGKSAEAQKASEQLRAKYPEFVGT